MHLVGWFLETLRVAQNLHFPSSAQTGPRSCIQEIVIGTRPVVFSYFFNAFFYVCVAIQFKAHLRSHAGPVLKTLVCKKLS